MRPALPLFPQRPWLFQTCSAHDLTWFFLELGIVGSNLTEIIWRGGSLFLRNFQPPNMTRSFRKKATWRSCQVFSWTGDYLTWSKLSSSLLTPCLGQACLDTTWSHNDIIEGFNTIKGGNGNKIRTMKYGMRSLRRCQFEDMHNPLFKKCWQCFFCSSSTPTS